MANKFLEKLDDIHLEIKLGSRKELLSFDEAALMLGFGKSYLYKLTSSRQIPHFKPLGKTIFFKRSELMLWIERSRVLTDAELLANQKRSHSRSYFNRKKDANSEPSKTN